MPLSDLVFAVNLSGYKNPILLVAFASVPEQYYLSMLNAYLS
ncbi:hypothetical protein C942_04532 [Photobacterium marinum]|uniref:Uncharacterized protein n=1 Tax=Photobacterium marinum TaxID=1056511 RepID=L8JF30_9GAMM|nr:hypothetical protein C942_04532 [Photobacterium marinum]